MKFFIILSIYIATTYSTIIGNSSEVRFEKRETDAEVKKEHILRQTGAGALFGGIQTPQWEFTVAANTMFKNAMGLNPNGFGSVAKVTTSGLAQGAVRIAGIAALEIGCILASAVIGAVTGAMIGVALAVLMPLIVPPALTASQIFAQLWGRVQNQAGNALSSFQTSNYQSNAETLMKEISNYISILTKTNPYENEPKVIEQLKSIVGLLDTNTVWRQNPGSTDKFVLCGPIDGPSNECLSLENGNVGDNAALVSHPSDLNALETMTISNNANGEIFFYGINLPYCFAYANKKKNKPDPDNSSRNLAIFQSGSEQCKITKTRFKLVKENNGYAIHDQNNNPLCADKKNSKILQFANGNGKHCKNKSKLIYRFKLTIPTNIVNSAGVTGNSVTATMPYDKLALQATFYPQLAGTYIIALKELAMRQPNSSYASQFNRSVENCIKWIDYHLPIFTNYCLAKGYPLHLIDSVVKPLLEFKDGLQHATLNPDLIFVDAVRLNKTSSPEITNSNTESSANSVNFNFEDESSAQTASAINSKTANDVNFNFEDESKPSSAQIASSIDSKTANESKISNTGISAINDDLISF